MLCEKRGVKLTKTRKIILELIWESHKPIKAYDLLDQLKKQDLCAKPPTVYRALEFLLEHHLIHKLHTLSAYVGCHTPQHDKGCFFFICQQCNHITEQHNMMYHALIGQAAKSINFVTHHAALEINGLCEACAA